MPSFISYELNKEDPLYETKSLFIGPKIEMAFKANGPKAKYMSKLRLALLNEADKVEEYGEILKSQGEFTAISMENEMKMLRVIKKLCHEKLSEFKRTKIGD